jgi:hypothetical protein
MTDAVSVLLVEADELDMRERTEQLLIDGYAVDQPPVMLAQRPDALVLSSLRETIGACCMSCATAEILASAASAATGASDGVDRVAVPPPCGRSRDGSCVSQGCDGWPQIHSLATEKTLRCRMISAMSVLPHRLLTDWLSDTANYTSTYRASYTVVYTKAKEVS